MADVYKLAKIGAGSQFVTRTIYAMQIELPDDLDLQSRAAAAGFASVARYIQMLIDRDVDRVAILEGIAAVKAGRVRRFDEFDREVRAEHGIPQGD